MHKELLERFRHFRNTDLARYADLYRRLATEGQTPSVLMVACSDSRIVPNLLTGTGPGELFIVRTIGNIVGEAESPSPDATVAAVEFAISFLGVREVIVCGHSNCGAVRGLYRDVPSHLAHLTKWIEQAGPARLDAESTSKLDEQTRDTLTAQRNVLLSLERLAAHPLVKERRTAKDLILHGWYYDIAETALWVFSPTTGQFQPVEALLDAL